MDRGRAGGDLDQAHGERSTKFMANHGVRCVQDELLFPLGALSAL